MFRGTDCDEKDNIYAVGSDDGMDLCTGAGPECD